MSASSAEALLQPPNRPSPALTTRPTPLLEGALLVVIRADPRADRRTAGHVEGAGPRPHTDHRYRLRRFRRPTRAADDAAIDDAAVWFGLTRTSAAADDGNLTLGRTQDRPVSVAQLAVRPHEALLVACLGNTLLFLSVPELAEGALCKWPFSSRPLSPTSRGRRSGPQRI